MKYLVLLIVVVVAVGLWRSRRAMLSLKFGNTGPPTTAAPVASAALTMWSSQVGVAISSSSIIRKC